jgi:hypothetical protein
MTDDKILTYNPNYTAPEWAQDKWIRVKDKLPLKRVTVHFIANKKLYIGDMSCKTDNNNWIWVSFYPESHQFISYNISHWLPLPEVPDEI